MKKTPTTILVILIFVCCGVLAYGLFLPKNDTATIVSDQTADNIQTSDQNASSTDSGQHNLSGTSWTWVRTDFIDSQSMLAPLGGKFVLTFQVDSAHVNSTTDCNMLSGSYVRDGEVLSFGPFISSKMYCEGSMEAEYAQQLSRTVSYVVEGTELDPRLMELHLILVKDSGTMIFERR